MKKISKVVVVTLIISVLSSVVALAGPFDEPRPDSLPPQISAE